MAARWLEIARACSAVSAVVGGGALGARVEINCVARSFIAINKARLQTNIG